MNATRFDRLVASFVATGGRRGLLRLLAALPLLGPFAPLLDGKRAAAKWHPRTRRQRRDQLKEQRKKKRKKCAKAGQTTSRKRKKCCRGLVKDASGRCTACATCDGTVCGSVPDGCGGMLTCSCPANHLCLDNGVCQPCTVTCSGQSAQCGTALQAALNGGGAVFVCPGRYIGNFTIPTAVTVVGAGEGTDIVSNTILDVGGTGKVLVINSGVGLVELERLRLTDSNAAQAGGGIVHTGTTLRMTECTVSGNINNVDGRGGGIAVGAGSTLEMTRCTVRDNHNFGTDTFGGGIYSQGNITLTDCLIEDNEASLAGGGLYLASGRATLLGTTQVRNNAAELGAGIFDAAATLIIAETCRVTENTADALGNGGGIRNETGAVALHGADPSPIVVNNCHENCAGPIPVANCAPGGLCPP